MARRRSYHYDILKIVKRWKQANLSEMTTSANVGAYAVPLGAPIRLGGMASLPTSTMSVAAYFRKKRRKHKR